MVSSMGVMLRFAGGCACRDEDDDAAIAWAAVSVWVPPSLLVRTMLAMSAAWASVRFKLTVTLVARSLHPCLFDIKDDGVAAYAFDGLGVGGADANNRGAIGVGDAAGAAAAADG